jgi:hypothetical protein
MMCFGWRPTMSCYKSQRQAQQGQGECASPNWFYALLGLAVIGGLASRK